MSVFKVLIAGQVFEIETIYAHSLAICRSFLTEGDPAFRIRITQEDIDFERKKIGFGSEDLSDRYLEELALLRKTAENLTDYDTFLMHGAAIAVEHKAYLFTGKSGTGKSTHIFLWKKKLPNAYIVNGDKPFISTGDTPMVYGSPWTGKERIFTNTAVPLAALVLMERAENNEMQRISFAEAFPFLYQQTYRPKDEARLKSTLCLLKSLETKVAFYRFRFNNFADDCFDVAYQALINGK